MLPLIYAPLGKAHIISKVGGKPQVRQHLEHLGFVPGGMATVLATPGGGVIVNIKDARVAISEEMAGKIMVSPGSKREEIR